MERWVVVADLVREAMDWGYALGAAAARAQVGQGAGVVAARAPVKAVAPEEVATVASVEGEMVGPVEAAVVGVKTAEEVACSRMIPTGSTPPRTLAGRASEAVGMAAEAEAAEAEERGAEQAVEADDATSASPQKPQIEPAAEPRQYRDMR